MGDLHDAECLVDGSLRDRQIAAVITLCPEDMSVEARESLAKGLSAKDVRHYELFARDDATYDLVGDAVLRAVEFVRPHYARGEPVLVHCFGGVNRAPAVGVALLMILDRLPLRIAVRTVVTKRGKVLTRRPFRAQLVQLAETQGLLGPMNDSSWPPASWKTSWYCCPCRRASGRSSWTPKDIHSVSGKNGMRKMTAGTRQIGWQTAQKRSVSHCSNLLWMGCAEYHVTWPVSQDSSQAIFNSFLSKLSNIITIHQSCI